MESTISVDEFQALEQKVLQTVEIIKKERAARAAAEADAAAAHAELAELKQILAASADSQTEIEALQAEREQVRARVESMLASLDELL
jgi:hypothetical protein